jgi:hypothetical protein
LNICFFVFQEEAEVTEALYHMSAGENLLRQKEERLKMLENTLVNDLVGYNLPRL